MQRELTPQYYFQSTWKKFEFSKIFQSTNDVYIMQFRKFRFEYGSREQTRSVERWKRAHLKGLTFEWINYLRQMTPFSKREACLLYRTLPIFIAAEPVWRNNMQSKFIVHNRALKCFNVIPLEKHFLPPTETKNGISQNTQNINLVFNRKNQFLNPVN